MDTSLNGPIDLGRVNKAVYFFGGNGSTAQTVYEGQGVCFNSDYGTAATAEPSRYSRVELPSSGNKAHFAGVLAENYTIPADGRFVTVYEPGSVCYIRAVASATINSTVFECTYTGGTWKAATNTTEGRGKADALQTVTYSATPIKVLAYLRVGDPCTGLAD